MNLEPVYNALESLGLKRLEVQLYIYLARNGPQKGLDLCQNLNLTKQQVYPCLKNLKEKDVVQATIDHPSIFSAKPFEDVLNLLIQNKVNEAKNTQHNKDQILRAWQLMSYGGSTENQ
jgi:sugar-specific transcriptional regulator TrmB